MRHEVEAYRNIFSLIFRCMAEISCWRSEVLKQVEEVGEVLMEEVKQVHAEAEVRKADGYCLSKNVFFYGICTGGCYQGGE